MKKAQNTAIKVACRLRPLNKLELSTGGECCTTYTDTSIKVKVTGEEKPHDFAFDHVFGPETPQTIVYDKVARPVLTGLMDGFNGTIFAYGQTSSGKTFTMEGPEVVDTDEKKGIIPRMMGHLFELILNSSAEIEFNVKVSFLELYNEKLQDLLDPRKTNLQIKEDKTKGIFVQDVTEVYITSAEEMRQVHKKGSENRTTAATRMNERSSRSHSIFILHLIQKNISTDASKHSKLYFVDLAGSEKISKTNVVGQQLEEAKGINKSLSALGLVINALTEKGGNAHVPYRDSKLTRLLQESLGGNSQTSLILAASMCSYNDKETLSTFRFGSRAKNIKNQVVMNVERSAKEYMALLDAAEKTIKKQEGLIEALEKQLQAAAQGQSIDLSFLSSLSNQQSKETAEDETKEEDEPEIENIQSTKEETPTGATGAQGSQSSASIKVLKQQIQIANMTEELQELKASKNELENEMKFKNQEIYDLNGKVMLYEHQLNELTTKNIESLENFRTQFDKVCYENQEKTTMMEKFLTALARLKSDLHFMYVSKNLRMLDLVEKSPTSTSSKESKEIDEVKQLQQLDKEDLIINSIQKTIETLEEIEKDLKASERASPVTKDTEALLEALLRDSEPSSTKRENISLTKSNQLNENNENEGIFMTSEDEIEPVRIEENQTEGEESFRLDLDSFGSVEELCQRLQGITNDESKISELQNLVSIQRKALTKLSKANAELVQTSQKNQVVYDKKIEGFNQKIESLNTQHSEKVKEHDDKISKLKTLLENKINEIENTKKEQDKELLEKSKLIADLRYQADRMQKIILGTDLPKKVYEAENKIRELALERQRLSQEIFQLREKYDEAKDLLEDKTSQTQLLQNNLNTLSTELEILKHFRPKPSQDLVPKKKDRTPGGGDSKTPQWLRDQMVSTDNHVIKPIRGGGGNLKNFEKSNNFLVYEKPSNLLQKKGSFQETGGSGPKDLIKEPKRDKARLEMPTLEGKEKNEQWAKLGEMLRSQNGKKNLMSHGKLNLTEAQNQSRNIYDKREEDKVNTSGTAKSARGEKDEHEGGQSGIKGMLKSFFS